MPVYTPEIYRRFATPLTLDLGPTAKVIDETRQLVEQVKSKTDPLPDIEQKLTDTRTVIEGAVTAAKNELLPKLTGLDTLGNKIDAKVAAQDQKLTDARTGIELAVTAAKNELLPKLVALEGQVPAQSKAVNDHTDHALKATADDIVKRLTAAAAPVRPPVPKPRAWPLLIPLVQAMTLALDQTPDAVHVGKDRAYEGWLVNDVQLDKLRKALTPAELGALKGAPNDLEKRFPQAFDRFMDADPDKRSQRLAAMVGLLYEVAAYVK